MCSSVWPSTPRLQDNSIMFSGVSRKRADARRLGSLSKGLRYIQQFRFYLILASSSPHRIPKVNIHSFSVFMSCIYFRIFLFFGNNQKDDKDNGKKMRKCDNRLAHTANFVVMLANADHLCNRNTADVITAAHYIGFSCCSFEKRTHTHKKAN